MRHSRAATLTRSSSISVGAVIQSPGRISIPIRHSHSGVRSLVYSAIGRADWSSHASFSLVAVSLRSTRSSEANTSQRPHGDGARARAVVTSSPSAPSSVLACARSSMDSSDGASPISRPTRSTTVDARSRLGLDGARFRVRPDHHAAARFCEASRPMVTSSASPRAVHSVTSRGHFAPVESVTESNERSIFTPDRFSYSISSWATIAPGVPASFRRFRFSPSVARRRFSGRCMIFDRMRP